ncbi:MAG: nickel/cobalt transporter (NicO) family protein [Alphaproteobacteria bacterium]|jgi:nickel/cobalt exporter|nr:nickel/cobalt transporter (NicO) family protein [Alphaproteobacteria bacterium]
MSVTPVARERTTRQVATLVIAIAAVLLLAGALDVAFAQGAPFGAPRPQAAPSGASTSIAGWIIAKQNEFYRQFSSLIRAAKADGSAVWSLLGVSFLYGVFHAAGPGHGKAVISSYVVANDETWRRGVVLSFASAILQALVAVVVVAIFAALLRATASTMRSAVDWIELVSYALIVGIGLRLLWVKGRALVGAARMLGRPKAKAGAAVPQHVPAHDTHDHHAHGHDAHDHAHDHHAHDHDHAHHDHDHAAHAHDDHSHHGHGPQPDAHAHHDHNHGDDASAWGHAHAPEPQELAGPGGWSRGLSAIVAVGMRPCSGAIIVLVFALTQGLFWAGVAATFIMGLGTAVTVAAIATVAVGARTWAGRFAGARSGYGMLALRGIEVTAALAIIAFGALLLTGYMASERLIGV